MKVLSTDSDKCKYLRLPDESNLERFTLYDHWNSKADVMSHHYLYKT